MVEVSALAGVAPSRTISPCLPFRLLRCPSARWISSVSYKQLQLHYQRNWVVQLPFDHLRFDGQCDRYRVACGDGHVEFDLLCRRCSYSVGPGVSGTGIVTASTGNDAFVTGFPVGGTFNISAGFSSQCGRFPWLCTSNQILDTSLIGGRVTPTGLAAVPSPLIGRTGILTLLCVVIVRLIGIGIE
jgi:hypothetical protein